MATWRVPHLDLLESRLCAVWWAVATIQPSSPSGFPARHDRGWRRARRRQGRCAQNPCGVQAGTEKRRLSRTKKLTGCPSRPGELRPVSAVRCGRLEHQRGHCYSHQTARSQKNSLRRVHMLDEDHEGMREGTTVSGDDQCHPMLRARHSSAQVRSVITITGLGDHDQPDWLITMTGIRSQKETIARPATRWRSNMTVHRRLSRRLKATISTLGIATQCRPLAHQPHRSPLRARDLLPRRGGQGRSAQRDRTNGRRSEEPEGSSWIFLVRRRTAWLPQGREHRARPRRRTVFLRRAGPAFGAALLICRQSTRRSDCRVVWTSSGSRPHRDPERDQQAGANKRDRGINSGSGHRHATRQPRAPAGGDFGAACACRARPPHDPLR